jgi:hypothetical protein
MTIPCQGRPVRVGTPSLLSRAAMRSKPRPSLLQAAGGYVSARVPSAQRHDPGIWDPLRAFPETRHQPSVGADVIRTRSGEGSL